MHVVNLQVFYCSVATTLAIVYILPITLTNNGNTFVSVREERCIHAAIIFHAIFCYVT